MLIFNCEYVIHYGNYYTSAIHIELWVNGTLTQRLHNGSASQTATYRSHSRIFKRGDYVEMRGGYADGGSTTYGEFSINRI